ncbi:MAG: hypothetical protein A2176_03290 [Spirochaetes bacterium RBG_13_51_14]|nr:MAG: hypothetical protein A2176_03290 [Spirochaetes bacterium RBG_13_51_14]
MRHMVKFSLIAFIAVMAIACDCLPCRRPGAKQTHTVGGVSFNLKYCPGAAIFPILPLDNDTGTVTGAYWIGETEVTYELWSVVYNWATTDTGAGKRIDGGDLYHFENPGVKGNDGAAGKSILHPVTTINCLDAMVWCNALSEMAGFSPVYKYGATVVRDSTNTAQCDAASADAAANGFRLVTSLEWELAARWRNDATNTVSGYTNPYFTKGNSASGAYTYYNDPNDINPTNGIIDGTDANDLVAWYSYNSGGSTHEVKRKAANALGIYDMSGNVRELCFDKNPLELIMRKQKGFGWNDGAALMQIGWYGFILSYAEDNYTGFRFARTQL